ncbi:MAG: hypothetical protein ACI9WU_000985 [Myxococcota bacterium]|jgi:hypothetical protein
MIGLELGCVAIVLLYVVVRARRDEKPTRFLSRLVLLMVASWIGENSVIHLYGFYAYSPDWSLFVDQVPIMIITIWPVVIHSAWDLAGHLAGSGARRIWLGSVLVFCDAWLIEPIAVQSGLWWWTVPGLFAVPPIGVLGWAFFAGLCMTCFDRERPLAALFVGPIGGHVLLLATWWGALRWISAPIPAWPAVALVAVLSALAMAFVIRRRLSQRVPLAEMLLRVPAASFFFVLLGIYGRGEWALIAWALAFGPPWMALTPWKSAKSVVPDR